MTPMSTKRKAPEPTGAAGKRRASQSEEPEAIDGNEDLLAGFDDIENEDALQSALEGDDGLGDDLGDEFEGGLEEGGEDGDDFYGDADEGEEEDDVPQSEAEEAPSECDDEEVNLPMDVGELQTASEIDLSGETVSAAQARRIAPLLCANSELTTIRIDGHELSVSDLREEDELEWDSEEFHDVEAIIIAEYLKTNESLKRLDLARNSIANAGCVALAQALKENTTLEYLNLESNVVAEKGGKALCDAMSTNTTLSYLNVMYNAIPSSGHEELRDLWTKAHGGSQLGLHL